MTDEHEPAEPVFAREVVTLYEHGAGREASTRQWDRWKVGREYVPLARLEEADAAYRQLAASAAELLGPRAPGAAAMFDEAAERGVFDLPRPVDGFHIGQLVPFLRAMADPEGTGLEPEDAAVIARIEQNVRAAQRLDGA